MRILLCFVSLLMFMGITNAEAKVKEIPVVVLAYAEANASGLCYPLGCNDPNELLLSPLKGYWFEKPRKIEFLRSFQVNRKKPLDIHTALVRDYTMQVDGTSQDIISGFVKKDHKKMWLVLEKALNTSRDEIGQQKNIKLVGYAVHPEAEDYLFSFVTYEDAEGKKKRRVFVFTLEDGRLKRTFSFAVERKDIYRVVETAFNSGGEDFKVYEYNKKTAKTEKLLEDPYYGG